MGAICGYLCYYGLDTLKGAVTGLGSSEPPRKGVPYWAGRLVIKKRDYRRRADWV